LILLSSSAIVAVKYKIMKEQKSITVKLEENLKGQIGILENKLHCYDREFGAKVATIPLF
jgi:hypothetical protein